MCAKVGRDEGDPNNKKDEHAERDELGLCEVFRKFPWFKSKKETNSCQEARVANQKPKSHHRAFITGDEDDLIDVMVPVAGGGGVVKPHHTDHDLNKCAQKHQQKLQVQPPPFTMETRGDLGLKHQKHSVGLDEDARDAEDKTDPEGWLA